MPILLYIVCMETIEGYRKEIEELKMRQDAVSEERRRLADRWAELNRAIGERERKIRGVEADRFREECEAGKHRVVNYSDIPEDLLWERTMMEKEISGGCTGDWNDGCRGCTHGCARKADSRFKEKYNIDEITYN